ncbi:MAG: 3-deoxy-D-manno-octulosonic acid transferase [Victivallales bacterium]
MLVFYNLLFPIILLLFLPGLIYKLIRRGGKKRGYLERFGIYSDETKMSLVALKDPVWIHAVSVGETQIALNFIQKWKKRNPVQDFVLSTTTTTGQEIAFTKAPEGTVVIFSPLDFFLFVKLAVNFIRPKMLVIFETELWPNMVCEVRRTGAKVALVNARISDRSAGRYETFRWFFGPILRQMICICAQTEQDKVRLDAISGKLPVQILGNMKFDQELPAKFAEIDFEQYFGKGNFIILLGASTHPREEKLIAGAFLNLKKKYPDLRFISVPRHAERGAEIAAEFNGLGLSFARRSEKTIPEKPVECLLADTTGELLGIMSKSDIVIVGKCFAGHDEGQNIIEPAILGKAIVTGPEMKNFRFVHRVLKGVHGVFAVESDDKLESAIDKLVSDENHRLEMGEKARSEIAKHRGATEKTIQALEKIL